MSCRQVWAVGYKSPKTASRYHTIQSNTRLNYLLWWNTRYRSLLMIFWKRIRLLSWLIIIMSNKRKKPYTNRVSFLFFIIEIVEMECQIIYLVYAYASYCIYDLDKTNKDTLSEIWLNLVKFVKSIF